MLLAEHDDPEVLLAVGDPTGAAMLVMTHDHQLDQTVIEWALRSGFGFVGGVGSRAKAAKTRQRLESKGFVAADVERVRMPLGVAIHARSPGEIAVAIAAELVAVRARRLGRERPERTSGS
jgi:xanthine dehydrogenase accessory factor